MLISEKNSLISTREKILSYLLLHRSSSDNNSSIKDIASSLGISTNAVRQHLVPLEIEGLIIRKIERGGMGRPANQYILHKDAFNLFPKLYSEFSLNLLDEIIIQLGEEPTEKILQKIGQKMAKKIQKEINTKFTKNEAPKSLEQRLERIITIFESKGKFPRLIEDKDMFSIKNYNCLFYDISQKHPIICILDQVIMNYLTGQNARKVECVSWGDSCCHFQISKNK
ncbi:MAG: helix-turn-helix transcriptional regulator [Candidatus Hodarchaeales archaeon]|jgi:predicted ArsR family transcriptional regulator